MLLLLDALCLQMALKMRAETIEHEAVVFIVAVNTLGLQAHIKLLLTSSWDRAEPGLETLMEQRADGVRGAA